MRRLSCLLILGVLGCRDAGNKSTDPNRSIDEGDSVRPTDPPLESTTPGPAAPGLTPGSTTGTRGTGTATGSGAGTMDTTRPGPGNSTGGDLVPNDAGAGAWDAGPP